MNGPTRLEVLRMRLDGMSYAAIGAKFERSRQRIQELLKPPKSVCQAVRERAVDCCESCNKDLTGLGHIHHKSCSVSISEYSDTKNLELLCAGCHTKLHIGDMARKKIANAPTLEQVLKMRVVMTSKQIKQARQKLGMTQEDFARAVGVRATSVHCWETGKHKPHAIFKKRIRELGKRKGAAA